MRSTLFSLATLAGLFALGNGPCGYSGDSLPAAITATPAVLSKPIAVDTPCACKTTGICVCDLCKCPQIVKSVDHPSTAPTIQPVALRSKAPSSTVCTPQGCFSMPTMSNRAPAASSCAGGACGTQGRSYRSGPVRRVFGGRIFGRGR